MYLTEIVKADLDYLTGKDIEQQHQSGALFLLKMKEQRQTTTDDMVEECRGLFAQSVSRARAGV